MALITEPNLGDTIDDVYAAIVSAHETLSPEESRRLDARLVLILANHIGDAAVIAEAAALARAGLGDADAPRG